MSLNNKEIKNYSNVIGEQSIDIYTNEPIVYYMVPERNKKKKWSIKNLFTKLFGKKEKKGKHAKKSNIKTYPNQYSLLISYARQLRMDQEKCEYLKKEYLKMSKKIGRRKKKEILKAEYERALNNLELAQSYLQNKMKEVNRSNLNSEDKKRILDEIYSITGIKLMPAHMKKVNNLHNSEETTTELKQTKEKIATSKHFSKKQKKEMLMKIREEIASTIETEQKKSKRR